MMLRLAGMLIAVASLAGCQAKTRPDAPDPVAIDDTRRSHAELDPWEPTNRKIHAFNRTLDKYVMRPIARSYVRAVPRPARQGVANFFNNLQQPIVAVNLLAQGQPAKSGKSFTRFLLNATFGIGGVFDVATAGGAPYYEADFGQTFALWGWEPSRYIVLPVFGGSTVRDGLGRLVNSQASPINWVSEREGPWVGLLYGITSRASALPNEAFMENAEDDYLLLRDVYFQRRACQIRDCTQDIPDYELPEELDVPDARVEPQSEPESPTRIGTAGGR
jgi:phospholipid-binding lipoprotein MlaA